MLFNVEYGRSCFPNNDPYKWTMCDQTAVPDTDSLCTTFPPSLNTFKTQFGAFRRRITIVSTPYRQSNPVKTIRMIANASRKDFVSLESLPTLKIQALDVENDDWTESIGLHTKQLAPLREPLPRSECAASALEDLLRNCSPFGADVVKIGEIAKENAVAFVSRQNGSSALCSAGWARNRTASALFGVDARAENEGDDEKQGLHFKKILNKLKFINGHTALSRFKRWSVTVSF